MKFLFLILAISSFYGIVLMMPFDKYFSHIEIVYPPDNLTRSLLNEQYHECIAAADEQSFYYNMTICARCQSFDIDNGNVLAHLLIPQCNASSSILAKCPEQCFLNDVFKYCSYLGPTPHFLFDPNAKIDPK